MNINNSFLQSFIGGIWYFRFPDFEPGPDQYYLFRSRIMDIEVSDEGLALVRADLRPNRFALGEWIDHQSKDGYQFFPCIEDKRRGLEIILPRFTLISASILQVEVGGAEAIIYAPGESEPDDLHVFRDFPVGYESMAGLGGIL
jgi:hypothetical protein